MGSVCKLVSGGFVDLAAPGLERELQGELRIEGFARADPRRAIEIADGVVELQGADGCLVGVVATAAATERGRIVDAVRQVVHLHAELRVDALADFRVLEDAQVHIAKAGRGIRIAGRRAPGAGSGIGKGSRVEPVGIDRGLLVAGERVAHLVGALIVFTRVIRLVVGKNGKREPVWKEKLAFACQPVVTALKWVEPGTW